MRPARPFLLSRIVLDAADRGPADPAVVLGEERIDHEELADRVARLGTALRSHGVAPGDRVVVFAPKSIDTYVAMHAAFHAGAIAAPIDPMTPAAAAERVVAELEPTAAVLASPTADRWPSARDDVVTVGHPVGTGSRHIDADHLAAVDPTGPVDRLGADPAYLITTSGSTGRPKSIVHTHASALRYAELAVECFGVTADDRAANVAPFHFDISTFELYAVPLAGAAAVLIPEVLLRFPASVSEVLERDRITIWYSVPTILRQLLDRGGLEQRDLTHLRRVMFGGEVFPTGQLRRLMELVPSASFTNVYGPAEVNQCTCHHLVGPPDDDVPIGRPWADTEIRLVDGDGTVVTGPGRGELQVRTATVMAGYWARPDLTDEAFVDEPGDGALVRRWYRTGDVVERDPRGLLGFVGRVDRQVKVRGVRIELEAIEVALGDVPGVVAAAAAVVHDPDPVLVAVVEAPSIDDGSSIARAVRASLPPASVPERIEIVDRLPRTTSGKIDSIAAARLVTEEAPA